MTFIPGTTVYSGKAVVPFTDFEVEDSVVIVGQLGISAGSIIRISIRADNDDVYAQDWCAPIVREVIAGIGFTVTIRPVSGCFRGPVNLDWGWI